MKQTMLFLFWLQVRAIALPPRLSIDALIRQRSWWWWWSCNSSCHWFQVVHALKRILAHWRHCTGTTCLEFTCSNLDRGRGQSWLPAYNWLASRERAGGLVLHLKETRKRERKRLLVWPIRINFMPNQIVVNTKANWGSEPAHTLGRILIQIANGLE